MEALCLYTLIIFKLSLSLSLDGQVSLSAQNWHIKEDDVVVLYKM